MNALPAASAADVFADRPYRPDQHLKLALYAVIATLIEACAEDVDTAIQLHPFLADYAEEIESTLGHFDAPALHWRAALSAWEHAAHDGQTTLPLLALQRAGLSALDLELLLAVGLIEEDPRFGALFEHAQREQAQDRHGGFDAGLRREGRPSLGLLMAWWRDHDGGDSVDPVRRSLHKLIELGLLQLPNQDAPRPDWTPTVQLAVWDGLRGELSATRWLRHLPHAQLPRLHDYIAPNEDLHCELLLQALRNEAAAPTLLIRGAVRNGRKTLAGVLAQALGKDLLWADASVFEDESRWRLFGVLAAMLDAVPAIEADSVPGETRQLAALPLVDAPLLVVTNRQGAWSCAGNRPVLDVELPLPDPAQRLAHWRACLPQASAQSLSELAGWRRLSSGHLRQVAASASAFARLAQREQPLREDLRRACRGLPTARLDTLATRLPAEGSLSELIVDDLTRDEIDALVTRCQWREPLAGASATVALGGVGVRALFAGPSGTGKTLAARMLAVELGKDVYRIDLASAVNKYLGETEKNLDRALSAAEELDVVLLLDEGDALMANRTDVGSSHDRYANLETNFLLQRIESFEGILVVTSNAADRIDRAFARRMDVVINFRAPDAWRRYEIVRLHLGDSDCDEAWLQDAASRCALSGGQWRNVVVHARLLALRSGGPVGTAHLQAALAREYRKIGGNCPMRVAEREPRPIAPSIARSTARSVPGA
ncbi:AAA family ATPase [Lysobacter capsici]|uniref:AAA family ATPase n=1 Tax=Lysobacter capsici TaxID=435897 RepID=UPI00287BC0B4|nr:ATP-binding protein [Lysobacter capsici]WND82967.1 ATP-binding protein [Lysobacter capsici]WND88166.1 ATP-binding protein [Lysobacter capsici]